MVIINKTILIKLNNKKPNLYSSNEVKKEKLPIHSSPNCPFCIVDFIEQERDRIISKHKSRDILWVKNKYPVSDILDTTLVIESNKCGASIHNYEISYLKDLICFIFEKKQEMIDTGLYDFIFIFRNYGKEASGSLPHSHTQINGLKKGNPLLIDEKPSTYGGYLIESSKNSSTEITLSNEPMGEFFELNISWSENETTFDAAFYLQKAIQYMDIYKNGLYESYNLIFNEINNRKYIKVIYRSGKAALTPYFLAWNVSLYYENYEESIELFRQFLNK